MPDKLADAVIAGKTLSYDDLRGIAHTESPYDLYAAALKIKRHFSGSSVDLCSIVNAKSGACPEDCSYCAQSAKSSADPPVYPLLDERSILEKAEEVKRAGVKRFCIVASGRKAAKGDLTVIAKIITRVREKGLLPCATLGLLEEEELVLLRDAGLERYHHNLETSERFFPNICTTHTYRDKLMTIEAAIKTGLSVCCGGIFGMGESWQDRIDMALAIKGLDIESVPINFLTPINGTPLSDQALLDPLEALKIISVFRFILPGKRIRICGGRLQTLGELNALVFLAGADGLLVGNYLTTLGRDIQDDTRLIRMLGYVVNA